MCHIFKEFLWQYLEVYVDDLCVHSKNRSKASTTEKCEKSFEKLKNALISLPILRALDWMKMFHVHVDASNFAIGCILAQLGEHNMDFSISYAIKKLISGENNYMTKKREGPHMIYVVKEFRHYLLANKFVSYTQTHQASLYLVNNLCNTGHIVQWFIILLDFDFTFFVKKGSTHQRDDLLSWLTNGKWAVGVDDDLLDEYLFNVEMAPSSSKDFVPFMKLGCL